MIQEGASLYALLVLISTKLTFFSYLSSFHSHQDRDSTSNRLVMLPGSETIN